MSGNTQPPRAVGDMKQGLTGTRPRMSLLNRYAAVHQVRGTEYGVDKYARGNYHGAAPAGVAPVERVLGYIDATMRHLLRVSDAVNRALGTGGDVVAALQTRDEDGGGKYPGSGLPDLSHALASLAIGISCAVDDGLLPADPGRPWDAELTKPEWAHLKPAAGEPLPQKNNPAAEKAWLSCSGGGPLKLSAGARELSDGVAADLAAHDASKAPHENAARVRIRNPDSVFHLSIGRVIDANAERVAVWFSNDTNSEVYFYPDQVEYI